MASKTKKWLIGILGGLTACVALPVALFFSLYLPPVQRVLKGGVESVVSRSLGLDVSMDGFCLKFPLRLKLDNVLALQPATGDTVLAARQLSADVQLLPLLKGKANLDNLLLQDAKIDTRDLIDGVKVKGDVGRLNLSAHGIDWKHEDVLVDSLRLDDSRLAIAVADTMPPDSTSAPSRWRIRAEKLDLNKVDVDFGMPLDTLGVTGRIDSAEGRNLLIDLGEPSYGIEKLKLRSSSLTYDSGTARQAEGLDYAHIAATDVVLDADSLTYSDKGIGAVVNQLSLREKSGLHITDAAGRVKADDNGISIPSLHVATDGSDITFNGKTDWAALNDLKAGRLDGRLQAKLTKDDLARLVPGLSPSLRKSYPDRPLQVDAEVEGNMSQLNVRNLEAELPGSFTLNGNGRLYNLQDDQKRSGTLHADIKAQDVGFLTDVMGVNDGSLVLPRNMSLKGDVQLNGQQLGIDADLTEQQGKVNLKGTYNMQTEAYDLMADARNLQVHHFLPRDSIFGLTAKVSAAGKGLDITSRNASSRFKADIAEVQYKDMHLTNMSADGTLKSGWADMNLRSDNEVLAMNGRVRTRLDQPLAYANMDVNIDQVDVSKLGIPTTSDMPFAMKLNTVTGNDSVRVNATAGDFQMQLDGKGSLQNVLSASQGFAKELGRQLKARKLDHAALRSKLPAARLEASGGSDNPLVGILKAKNISFGQFDIQCHTSPQTGMNGDGCVTNLKVDTLLLDTVCLDVYQDLEKLAFKGYAANGPNHPQVVFRSTVDGEVRTEDADVNLVFLDGQGEKGVDMGFHLTPQTYGAQAYEGLKIEMTPGNPIVAFREFHFKGDKNWVFLRQSDMRVFADVDMASGEGLSFKLVGDDTDTESLQNLNLELNRVKLEEVCGVMPYLPKLTGLFSVDGKYVKTAKDSQFSADGDVKGLTYEGKEIGDTGLGITWLPDDQGVNHLNGYMTYDEEEVLYAGGTYTSKGKTDALDMNTTLTSFPAQIINAFVPRNLRFAGRINGELAFTDRLSQPTINGTLRMDSVQMLIPQASAAFRFDNKEVAVVNNKLQLTDYSLYAIDNQPLVINGEVDLSRLTSPAVNLLLKAENYTLFDAKKSKQSILYGKMVVDLMADLHGPVDALIMRGQMNVLDQTDATYVMDNSPLTVEDRLGELVTFVQFNDTLAEGKVETAAMTVGGMDMLMMVHISDGVQLKADLTSDGSKYIRMEGGGDLNWQYTPQGDMKLTGRYTLTGGSMKYSLPVIPLKEFEFTDGSYVEWRGDLMDPKLKLTATERVRAAVANDDDKSTRRVNFDVSVSIEDKLSSPQLTFDLSAPEDSSVQNELLAMGSEERSKVAITMLATGTYMSGSSSATGLTLGTALNSVLQSQINTLVGAVDNANISVGVEDRTTATGATQTDYSFRYSQRFLNNRVQINIGGKVTTGHNATNTAESFIDNISLEYRLDSSSAKYVRAFYKKNYEDVLDGEITETGVGLVLHKRMDKLSELFIFKKKDKNGEAKTDEK